jgi:hypothetical protein
MHFVGCDRERLSHPQAQATVRPMTAIWGIAFIGEATVRVALSFVLEPAVLMTVSPGLPIAVFGPLGLWTMQLSRRQVPRLSSGAA